MNLETLRAALFWSSVINVVLLLLWTALATLGRTTFHALVRHVLRISEEHFDLFNLAGISLYKVGILLFNIVPAIALQIVK